jgi:preprotein translocase subunit SecD
MLLGVLGSNVASPGSWHKSFKVGLGLDLSWGTQITLLAHAPTGHSVTAGAMAKAKSIMFDRVNADGFVGATVVQQGTDEMVVSVPHEGAQQVANLVGNTAQLAFRQVLLGSTNEVTPSSTTTTPSPSPSASPSTGSKASAAPSASASAAASASPSSGSGQAVGATALSSAKPKSSASPKASASTSPSPSASATPSPSASAAAKPRLATWEDGSGDPGALTAQTKAQFNALNCNDKKWQLKLYGPNPADWARLTGQAVSCYKLDGTWYKYALAAPVITGQDLSAVGAEANTAGAGWIVNFNVKSGPASALGALTKRMAADYYPDFSTNADDYYLAQLAVVLDGQVTSSPNVESAITTSGEINGGSSGFSQGQATSLANILKYGQLPLTFQTLDSSAVSPQLGSAQLSAGIIAGIIGLILVVIYSFIYYRGLAVVSVSSLAIAAAITYMAVVLLSKYESFNMTLAGIAGLIVAIGVTADSFIVFFERLRDEVREGRSLRAAVERGWTRARRTILVSDTVSFLAALLLYILAIGDVRNFAFTLGLTTLVDVVVVFLFTKPMVTLLARTRFYGDGHKLSGLDASRLGARAPWRGSRRPATSASATTKEA